MTVEAQGERNGLPVAIWPGWIGDADDPRVIGIFRKDNRQPFVEFGDGGAVGKRAFLGGVGGALPFADVNDAERAAGKTCGAKRHAGKRRQHRTQ